jgi:hypothetical protein
MEPSDYYDAPLNKVLFHSKCRIDKGLNKKGKHNRSLKVAVQRPEGPPVIHSFVHSFIIPLIHLFIHSALRSKVTRDVAGVLVIFLVQGMLTAPFGYFIFFPQSGPAKVIEGVSFVANEYLKY